MKAIGVGCVVSLLVAVAATAGDPPPAANPYVGLGTRAIKALSAEQVDDLRAGRGMGLAMAAELNGYPGPKHLLELARELELDGPTLAGVQASFDRMAVAAKGLGAELVEAESALDALFREERADPESVRAATAEIGRLQGALRATHLVAHLEMKALLTKHQAHAYARLRGYGSGAEHTGHR